MKLIKKLGTILSKIGRKQSWGIFLCPHCLQEVEKILNNGYIQKSCGCVRGKLTSKGLKGYKHTEETRQLMKENHADFSGENNPNYGNGDKVRGSKNPMYGKTGKNNPMYGVHRFNKESPNWQGGKSFEIYPKEFKKIKQFILERDNYKCQYPGCTEIHDRLHIHHIDYNKNNNNPENLITLGTSCHTKTNGKKKRLYWTEFYQHIMMGKLTTKEA